MVRPLPDALALQWPHAIGVHDENSPGVWLTDRFERWEEVLLRLAQCRATLRTSFPVGGRPDKRHLLGVPITNHPVPLKRLGDQLRFKIFKVQDGAYQGVLYHLPGKFPERTNINELDVWKDVYNILDGAHRTNCHPRSNPRCHNSLCNPVDVNVRRLA